ncbi:MAG: hypothetical protein IT306_16060 [Chloroflexi bacterium]|nr:hypothetical protein [Chloroflexota bacterium]
MAVRRNPELSVGEIEAALRSAASAAWGDDALPEVEQAVPSAARALWRISQESFERSDIEP